MRPGKRANYDDHLIAAAKCPPVGGVWTEISETADESRRAKALEPEMVRLKTCVCCSLLQGSIITGVYVTIVYLVGFIMELSLVMEGENWINSGREKGPLPLPGYVMVVLHFTVVGLAIIMLYAIYQRRIGVLIAWVFVSCLLILPELAIVLFLVFYHWGFHNAFGIAEILFYIVRAPVNAICIACVHSLYSTWKQDMSTERSLKKLSDLQMIRELNHKPLAFHNAAYRASAASITDAASPAGSLRGSMVSYNPSKGVRTSRYGVPVNGTIKTNGSITITRPPLSRRFSAASQFADYQETYAKRKADILPNLCLELPSWNPYSIPDSSASEFNASLYPRYFPSGGPSTQTLSKSEQTLYIEGRVPRFYIPSPMTYPISPAASGLVDFDYGPKYARQILPANFSTQSLDRRRRPERSHSFSYDPYSLPRRAAIVPYYGYPRHQGSKSSIGMESDDFRRYRDVAL